VSNTTDNKSVECRTRDLKITDLNVEYHTNQFKGFTISFYLFIQQYKHN